MAKKPAAESRRKRFRPATELVHGGTLAGLAKAARR